MLVVELTAKAQKDLVKVPGFIKDKLFQLLR